MKLLVVSNLYPPAVLGGYEVECQVVVDALRARGDEVVVLTGDRDARAATAQRDVRRELAFLSQDARGSLRAPRAALRQQGKLRLLAPGEEIHYHLELGVTQP